MLSHPSVEAKNPERIQWLGPASGLGSHHGKDVKESDGKPVIFWSPTQQQMAAELVFRTVLAHQQSFDIPQPELVPSHLNPWLQMDKKQLAALTAYITNCHEAAKNLLATSATDAEQKILLPNKLKEHIQIMMLYFDELCGYPKFTQFLQDQGISPEFLHALCWIHDFPRFMANGQFSLQFNDALSGRVIQRAFSKLPTEYLHSIFWILDAKKYETILSSSTPPHTVAKILKAIDTIGKPDNSTVIIDPDNFFQSNGRYHRWLERQTEVGNLPIKRHGGKSLSVAEYQQRDMSLTLAGITLMEEMTGRPITAISEAVKARYQTHTPCRS